MWTVHFHLCSGMRLFASSFCVLAYISTIIYLLHLGTKAIILWLHVFLQHAHWMSVNHVNNLVSEDCLCGIEGKQGVFSIIYAYLLSLSLTMPRNSNKISSIVLCHMLRSVVLSCILEFLKTPICKRVNLVMIVVPLCKWMELFLASSFLLVS